MSSKRYSVYCLDKNFMYTKYLFQAKYGQCSWKWYQPRCPSTGDLYHCFLKRLHLLRWCWNCSYVWENRGKGLLQKGQRNKDSSRHTKPRPAGVRKSRDRQSYCESLGGDIGLQHKVKSALLYYNVHCWSWKGKNPMICSLCATNV